MSLAYSFHFIQYWHCGSGKSGNSTLDSIVVKTTEGLPFVPGRTAKGLFKEACLFYEEQMVQYKGNTEALFGTLDNENDDRFSTNKGILLFSNLEPEEELKKMPKKVLSNLFTTISSTSIEDSGIAEDKSLRTVEVVIPMTLKGKIDFRQEVKPETINFIKKASKSIRFAGAGRHRGFGRVEVEFS